MKIPSYLEGLHPDIVAAFMSPFKKKPRLTRVQKQGYDRRKFTRGGTSRNPKPAAPKPPLLIDVTQPDNLPVEWFRAKYDTITASGLGPERAVNELLRKVWKRGLRFGVVTISHQGRQVSEYPSFAEIALVGIPIPGERGYVSHILRRKGPYEGWEAPPECVRAVDAFGRLGPPSKPCEHCGKLFEWKAPQARFCGDLCRLHANRALHTASGRPTPAAVHRAAWRAKKKAAKV
jgi:hypothetical protein